MKLGLKQMIAALKMSTNNNNYLSDISLLQGVQSIPSYSFFFSLVEVREGFKKGYGSSDTCHMPFLESFKGLTHPKIEEKNKCV